MGDVVRALGMMSGTSLDGIDAALIHTDGERVKLRGSWLTVPFERKMRERLRAAMHGEGDMLLLERDLTLLHADVVKQLLVKAQLKPVDVSVIGFHGQTIIHRPKEGITWQMGNGALLAEKTGISVVADFRRRDVAAGGEGAPFVPLYHAALSLELELPVAVLNLGGIGNVTWIGRSEAVTGSILAHDIFAFDTGPGNVLLNEWMEQKAGAEYDRDGKHALAGRVDAVALASYMADPYFRKHPPKSLDRNDFTLKPVEHLSVEDGAATLTAFTAEAVAAAAVHFPVPARRWLVCGGGRHNPAIMQALAERLSPVEMVEAVGWEGDALEAQAFAFLAVRSIKALPLSLPTTTGVSRVVTGGAFYQV